MTEIIDTVIIIIIIIIIIALIVVMKLKSGYMKSIN